MEGWILSHAKILVPFITEERSWVKFYLILVQEKLAISNRKKHKQPQQMVTPLHTAEIWSLVLQPEDLVEAGPPLTTAASQRGHQNFKTPNNWRQLQNKLLTWQKRFCRNQQPQLCYSFQKQSKDRSIYVKNCQQCQIYSWNNLFNTQISSIIYEDFKQKHNKRYTNRVWVRIKYKEGNSTLKDWTLIIWTVT